MARQVSAMVCTSYSMPRSTEGTNTRSTHWPESDSLKIMPELRGAGASLSATSAELPCSAGLLPGVLIIRLLPQQESPACARTQRRVRQVTSLL
jgi:hypothetical protein